MLENKDDLKNYYIFSRDLESKFEVIKILTKLGYKVKNITNCIEESCLYFDKKQNAFMGVSLNCPYDGDFKVMSYQEFVNETKKFINN